MRSEFDTIFALASGAGRAGISVVRISGRRAGDILTNLVGGLPTARRASLRILRDEAGAMLDEAIVLWFPPPRSYTGEACVELHLHGGTAVLDAVTDVLVTLGARPAEPGEFTRRAFLNGRMDLIEAEAVADLIDAETASQRSQALRQLGGALTRTLESWRARLITLMAQQEALVDFPDEDLPDEVGTRLVASMDELRTEIALYLNDDRRGERLRNGITIVVTGDPNVGKTSLVNRLANREVGIVSSLPGTTRDTLEVRVILGGVPATLVDTAGIRDTADPIEAEGIRRAREQIQKADIILALSEMNDGSAAATDLVAVVDQQSVIRVSTKVDLAKWDANDNRQLGVSVVTGHGLNELRQCLDAEIQRLTQSGGQAPLTRVRHRAALKEVCECLNAAKDAPAELRAEDLRMALRSLGRITGQVGVEEILSQIFSQFCVGK